MFLYLLCSLFFAFATAIWPIPSTYTHGHGVLWIDSSVEITYNVLAEVPARPARFLVMQWLRDILPQQSSYGSKATQNNIIETAMANARDTISNKNFVPWRFHPRNTNFQPNAHVSRTCITSISLSQNGTDPAGVQKPLAGDNDESYSLSISSDGTARITAATSIGLAHGLTTFTQLFYKHADGSAYTTLAPVEIYDSPKFSHRGLNLDISRAFYPPSDVMRMIDALAYNKMNRLHLHASDSQSWPVEIPSLPLLAAKGAYESSLTYSPAALDSIQQYGSDRGVEVIIEFDMPGHTTSIAYGYPDLVAAFDVQPEWDDYAAEPPSGTLKLNSSAVATFLHTLLHDILPRVKPHSSYFHTGGDEVNANAYKLDETVRSNDTQVLQPLIQAFVDRIHAQVRAAGLTPIVWEEMLLQWNLTLGSDVVVQTWISDDSLAQTVKLGHKALAGNYNFWVRSVGTSTFEKHLLTNMIVSGLWTGPFLRLLPRHLINGILALRRLLLAPQELASDVLLRPFVWRARGLDPSGPRRRDTHVV